MVKFKLSKSFTLLEILVVMVVIVFMTTIIAPWILRKKPEATWNAVLSEFNNMLYFARQEAITNQKNFRLFFKTNPDSPDFITVEKEEEDPEDSSKKIYKQIFSDYFPTRYTLPDGIKLKAFYLGKKESFEENKGTAYCYVIPNGMVQDVMIYLVKTVEKEEQKATFKGSPFYGKFEFFEGFVKPEK